jgi:hypothetical protein
MYAELRNDKRLCFILSSCSSSKERRIATSSEITGLSCFASSFCTTSHIAAKSLLSSAFATVIDEFRCAPTHAPKKRGAYNPNYRLSLFMFLLLISCCLLPSHLLLCRRQSLTLTGTRAYVSSFTDTSWKAKLTASQSLCSKKRTAPHWKQQRHC